MADLREEKNLLRKSAAQRLRDLPKAELERESAAITARVQALDAMRKAQSVFCYVSVQKEPDTHALLEHLLSLGKCVAVPRCQEAGVMEACRFQGFSELQEAAYGLLEPSPKAQVIKAFDLVVAPCVAAGKDGRRLGHGGGYYDRFLQEINCPVICLCYEALLLENIPCEEHDRRMDFVVTGKELYRIC